ncbi:type II toxin-antitoxin system RelE/ParE family toxin [Nanoarchaeota archaeon]
MIIDFSEEFRKEFRKIKDYSTWSRIIKQVEKLENNPSVGKPLRNKLKNHRCLRVKPYRIIYRIEGDTIVILCFDHRDVVY